MGENEGPVVMDVLPPKSNTTKWMKSYEDLEEPFKARANGTYTIPDLEYPDDASKSGTLRPEDGLINIVGTFHDQDGNIRFLSENCAYPKDKEGNPLPRRWLGINPRYQDEDIDSLSSETLDQSRSEKAKAKEKVIAVAGTINGIVHRAFFKTKKGSGI